MTFTKSTTVENGNSSLPFSRQPVIILGAGIIGCATARQLLLKGFQVTLVAEFLPGDQSIYYASAWAGAAWHAASGLINDHKYIQAVTHRHLLKLAQEEPEAGVCIVKSREYLEELPGKNSSIWGKTVYSNVARSGPSMRSLAHTCYSSENLTRTTTHPTSLVAGLTSASLRTQQSICHTSVGKSNL